MKKKKHIILLWGLGRDYEGLIQKIEFEVLKGNVEVAGMVSRDKYCEKKDGHKVYLPEEALGNVPFDYVVVTSGKYFEQIKSEIVSRGIEPKRIINGVKVFHIPLFDFDDYVSLIENPVSIICDDCWAGYVYHRLDLQFTTPCINIFWDRDEYIKLIQRPEYFLKCDLKMYREGSVESGVFPMGILGEGDDVVKMKFVHNKSFSEAKAQWDKRCQRINWDNLLIKFGFSSALEYEVTDRYIETFRSLNHKKVLFYYSDEEIENCFKTNRFIWSQLNEERVEFFDYNDYIRKYYYWDINIFKLLRNGAEYSRYY